MGAEKSHHVYSGKKKKCQHMPTAEAMRSNDEVQSYVRDIILVHFSPQPSTTVCSHKIRK